LDTGQIIAGMTVEQKVGQMMLGSLPGTELDADAEEILRRYHIGGVILFARNIASVEQTRALTGAIHRVCTVHGLPPMLGVDQEGGRVKRLMAAATGIPSAMALGATGDPALAGRVMAATGRELRALGINTDFAPCVDVNNNPRNPVIGTRSYGESPARVGAFGVAVLEGLRGVGVAATAKHFPGHGDTHTDSHLDLPVIPHDLGHLHAVELPPFGAAIRAGVPLVMTSHISFPALEPDGIPATLSRRILTGLLREELGFEGVIISDAMMMQAITDTYGIVAGSVRAVIAGVDLVGPMAEEPAIIEALLEAVRDGRLPMAQVDASVRRVLRLKQWLAAKAEAPPADVVGCEEHRALVREAAAASVTVLDAPHACIAAERAVAVVEFTQERGHQAEAISTDEALLHAAFVRRFPRARHAAIHAATPTPEDVQTARALVQASDVLVIGTRDANRFPEQMAALAALRDPTKPSVIVSLRAPYDLDGFPWATARIAAYGDLPASLDVVADICAGALTPRGHLPVTVGPHFPVGHGLTAAP
jgi:beta-N-acetylhexosaminidase